MLEIPIVYTPALITDTYRVYTYTNLRKHTDTHRPSSAVTEESCKALPDFGAARAMLLCPLLVMFNLNKTSKNALFS